MATPESIAEARRAESTTARRLDGDFEQAGGERMALSPDSRLNQELQRGAAGRQPRPRPGEGLAAEPPVPLTPSPSLRSS